nr:T9SS type A sorting domain-containing protein [Allomuricauda sp.]
MFRILFLILLSTSIGFGQSGQLEPTFGINGIVKFQHISGNETARAIVEDDQGRLVITGSALSLGPPLGEFPYITRLMPNGDPDLSFGNGAFVELPDLGPDVIPEALAFNPINQKYYIIGRIRSQTGPLWDLFVLAYDTVGVMDSLNFGTDGVAIFPSTSNAVFTRINIQNDGKLLIGGFKTRSSSMPPDTTNVSILRLFPDGRIDSTFGQNGYAEPNFHASPSEYFKDFFIDEKERIFGVGSIREGYSIQRPFVFRFSKDGQPDLSFHNLGYTLIDTAQARPFGVWSMDRHITGDYIIAGAYNSTLIYPCLMRIDTLGNLKHNFGNGGFAIYSTPMDGGFSKCINQGDGRILALGGVQTFSSIADVLVGKFTKTGFPTAGRFGPTGIETYDFNSSYETAYDMVLTKDSGIVVIGNIGFPLGESFAFKVQNEFNVGLRSAIKSGALEVFPNPAKDQLNISGVGILDYELGIMNSFGKEFQIEYRQKGEELVVNTSDLSPGLYIFRISDGEREFVEKVMIE